MNIVIIIIYCYHPSTHAHVTSMHFHFPAGYKKQFKIGDKSFFIAIIFVLLLRYLKINLRKLFILQFFVFLSLSC